MGVFNNFPYANFHELNADWIIEQVRKVMDEWEEYRTDMNLWKLGVDDQLAEFQTWFDNLDVQDEVRTVMNELILSGEFIEITSPQIVSATEAWLAAHITPTTPAVDDTLSISGAAADAKVTGDRISDLKEDIEDIEDNLNYNKDATPGYILTATNDGDGSVWSPVGLPSDEQTVQAVTDWLNEHPEATTTVADGSISKIKLNNDLQLKQATIITNYDELVDAINDGDRNNSYNCKTITINDPINISVRSQLMYKSFTNGVFVLNSTMFTWETPSAYHNAPNFVNCTFIGNGNSIFVDNAYVLNGKFVNCNFVDCSIVKAGTFVQSMRFINCTIENQPANNFITAKQVYDVRFIGCQAEAQNKATIVNANGTATNMQTINQLTFLNCVLEGQINPIVITHDGDLTINNCYTEANSSPFARFLYSNRTGNGIFRVCINNTKINPTSGVNFIEVDQSYESSVWSFFKCINSSIAQGNLINTNNLYDFVIESMNVSSNGKRPPSIEPSKVDPMKNSIVDFTTSGHCIVKKFPCLITFDSSDGGWHTNLYLVSLSYNNTPYVKCLNNPSAAPTASYDNETGYVDVTLHSTRGVYSNTSAVLLNGQMNDLIRRNYYEPVTYGYDV